jgi:hypothetical protein
MKWMARSPAQHEIEKTGPTRHVRRMGHDPAGGPTAQVTRHAIMGRARASPTRFRVRDRVVAVSCLVQYLVSAVPVGCAAALDLGLG